MLIDNVLQAIGNTPLIRLNKILAADGKSRIFVKAEFMNPGGSIKDRAALNMLNSALESGRISRSTLLIEPTSGNTGIGLAVAAAVKNMRLVLTMPESMSIERRKILSAYGAKIVLTPASEGMKGAINKAKELAESEADAFIPSQFDNPDNRRAHFLTTAPEIFRDLPSAVAVVSGVGTGGTASGIADYIRANNLKAGVYAVEPSTSAVISGEAPGKHNLQGIGAGFIPSILDKDALAGVIKCENEQAYEFSRRLAREEGIMVGISSGAALFGAVKLSEKLSGDIVAILPDTGMRYLSTELYE